MKNLIYILGLFGVLGSTIISCTPEDKNLNRPNNFGAQGTAAKNLRIGTLGQTIWAVQNVEQVGSLIRVCQDSGRPVENLNSKMIKNCQLLYKADSKASEKWNVKAELNDAGEVIYATGDLVSGYTTFAFKSINGYTQFDQKSFVYSVVDKKIKISVDSQGEIGSKVDNIKFVHEVAAQGTVDGQSWKLSNFEHELTLLNLGQGFKITSNDVTLDWSSPVCADATGIATAVEFGKEPSIVTFDATLAKSEKPKWSQKIPKCGTERGERKYSSLYFEYLFF